MDLFSLKGRVALVTGASSGLGRRFALVLAQQGADVAILARRYERLEGLAKEIEALGVRCHAVQCDVTDEDKVNTAVEYIIKKLGKIDILVNNAGVAAGGKAEEHTGEDFRWVMNVNVNGAFYVAREVGKNMIKNQYGRIINIGSMYGEVGNKFSPCISYHTSKGAVRTFAKALAAEWAKYGITVNNIGPGFFMSEMTDRFAETEPFTEFLKQSTCMERVGRVDELDTALLFLAADKSSYITGQTILVDGGWTTI